MDFNVAINREKFNDLVSELFKKVSQICEKCVKDAGLIKSQIHEIILSGGCSRIPHLQSLLSFAFPEILLFKQLNPDECVSQGASIMSALCQRIESPLLKDLLVLDVVHHHCGIENDNG